MHGIQRKTEEFREALQNLTQESRSAIEKRLRRLQWHHFAFLRETLDHARIKTRSPAGRLRLLENHFEAWQTQDLPTKLAIISCVACQFGSQTWPGDTQDDQAVRDIIASPCSVKTLLKQAVERDSGSHSICPTGTRNSASP